VAIYPGIMIIMIMKTNSKHVYCPRLDHAMQACTA
jgi:hypothetical protein